LIREDEKRKAEERPEALPVEGVEGNDAALTRTDWKDIRKEALAQVKTRQKNRR
jgi:hypothetical protein